MKSIDIKMAIVEVMVNFIHYFNEDMFNELFPSMEVAVEMALRDPNMGVRLKAQIAARWVF